MLVRQPISKTSQIVLGIASIGLLIGAYSVLAHLRLSAKRADIQGKIDRTQGKLDELQAAWPTDQPPDDASAEAQQSLQTQLATLQVDFDEAEDRSVPTLRELYDKGLLRSLKQPRTFDKDEFEYWLWDDLRATLSRLIAGLSVGVLASVVIGILMGAYTPVEAFFSPPLSFLAKIPPTAMMAVYFVLVGTAFKMYVTMIALGTLPTLAQTIFQSAKKDVPESLIYKAYTLGASHPELIWNVIYKQILPRLIDAARLQIGPAMVLLVAAEWMVADEGFGHRLRLFYQRTDMTVVYVYLVILGVGGLLVDNLLIRFRRWLCPWFGE